MKKFKKVITSMVMAASMLAAMPAGLVKGAGDEATAAFDPAGTYHAAMGIQTCNTLWINRQAYFIDTLNKTYGTDLNNTLWGGDPSAEGAVYKGTFTDIELAGNGTYTVKLEGADFAGETSISQLYVATDIPVNDDIKVTDYKVNINGKDIVTFPEAELEDEEDYTAGGMIILAINHWRTALVQKLADLGVEEDDANGIVLLNGTGDDNITLTFTISGFNYDKTPSEDELTSEDAGESAAEDAVTTAAADNTDSKKDSKFPVVPVVIGGVAAVIVVVAVIVTVSKKKK